jgi:alpha-L-fucosidase 2
MAGAWLCRHLWEHYAFTLDREFLEETAFPIMKESAEFILDWLVEDEDGYLVTIPSTSPENIYLTSDGERCAVDTGTAMDIEIITDHFSKCILSAEILGIENDFASSLRNSLKKLMPIKTSDGRLLEWSRPYIDEEIGHRHMSHLYALFPGDIISIDDDKQLSQAAVNSINYRLENGGGNTGWSRAWIIALWARLRNSQKVKESIDYFLSDCVHPNMTGYQPPSFFQIDANFGFTAAIAEIFLQSHDGLYFLPALPPEWKKGHISGLKARGGYTIDISWQGGRIGRAIVQSSSAGVCQIKNTNIKRIIRDNKEIEWSRELKYARFKHGISESYEIHFLS